MGGDQQGTTIASLCQDSAPSALSVTQALAEWVCAGAGRGREHAMCGEGVFSPEGAGVSAHFRGWPGALLPLFPWEPEQGPAPTGAAGSAMGQEHADGQLQARLFSAAMEGSTGRLGGAGEGGPGKAPRRRWHFDPRHDRLWVFVGRTQAGEGKGIAGGDPAWGKAWGCERGGGAPGSPRLGGALTFSRDACLPPTCSY